MDSKEKAAARLFIEKMKPFVTKDTEYDSEVYKTLITDKLYEAINEVDKDLDSSLVFLCAEKELLDLKIKQLKKM